MNFLIDAPWGAVILPFGIILFVIGILPINRISLNAANITIEKPLNAWQRFFCVLLGTVLLFFAFYPGNGLLPKRPHSTTFNGVVCEPKADYLNLMGDRIFLRTSEFQNLNLPIGSRVKLTVDLDGTQKSSLLILDSDNRLSQCSLSVNQKIRRALNLDTDTNQTLEERPMRSWEITG